MGTSGCGIATYDQIMAMTQRTEPEITAVVKSMKQFNQGLYDRSNYVRQSAEGDGFRLRIALRFLHNFFDLDLCLPAKRLISVVAKLGPSQKCLIKDPSLTSNYSLHVTKASLDVGYVVLESSIRSAWYEMISSEKLLRVYDSCRESHFTLAKGSKTYQYQDVNPHGPYPRFVSFFFSTEAKHIGNWTPRYCYVPHKLTSVELTSNGHSWFDADRIRNMDLTHVDGMDTNYWYQQFLKCYGEKAKSICIKRFHSELYLFCLDLVPLMTENSLSLLTSATISLQLEFSEPLTENLIIYVHSHRKALMRISEEGEVLES